MELGEQSHTSSFSHSEYIMKEVYIAITLQSTWSHIGLPRLGSALSA